MRTWDFLWLVGITTVYSLPLWVTYRSCYFLLSQLWGFRLCGLDTPSQWTVLCCRCTENRTTNALSHDGGDSPSTAHRQQRYRRRRGKSVSSARLGAASRHRSRSKRSLDQSHSRHRSRRRVQSSTAMDHHRQHSRPLLLNDEDDDNDSPPLPLSPGHGQRRSARAPSVAHASHLCVSASQSPRSTQVPITNSPTGTAPAPKTTTTTTTTNVTTATNAEDNTGFTTPTLGSRARNSRSASHSRTKHSTTHHHRHTPPPPPPALPRMKVRRSTKVLTLIAVIFLLPIPACVIAYVWLPQSIVSEYAVLLSAVVCWIASQSARDVLSLSRVYLTFKNSVFEYSRWFAASLLFVFSIPPLCVFALLAGLVLDPWKIREWVTDDEASTIMIVTVSGNLVSTMVFSLMFATRLFRMNVSQAVMAAPPLSLRSNRADTRSAARPTSSFARRRLSSVTTPLTSAMTTSGAHRAGGVRVAASAVGSVSRRRRDSITALSRDANSTTTAAVNPSSSSEPSSALLMEGDLRNTSASLGFAVATADSAAAVSNAGNIALLDSMNTLQTSLASDQSLGFGSVKTMPIIEDHCAATIEEDDEEEEEESTVVGSSEALLAERYQQQSPPMDCSETRVDSLLITDEGRQYSAGIFTPSVTVDSAAHSSQQRSMRSSDVKLAKHQQRMVTAITKMMVLSVNQLMPAVMHAAVLSLCLWIHRFQIFVVYWFYTVSFEVMLSAICLQYSFKVSDSAYHKRCFCHQCCARLFEHLTRKRIAEQVSRMDLSFA